ncbi:hypothetical protein ABZY09_30550 [Streptomyces sp. NPDC002928]
MDYELIKDDERDQFPLHPFLDLAARPLREPEETPEVPDVAS